MLTCSLGRPQILFNSLFLHYYVVSDDKDNQHSSVPDEIAPEVSPGEQLPVWEGALPINPVITEIPGSEPEAVGGGALPSRTSVVAYVLGCASVLALVLCAALFWWSASKRFPRLPTGTYVGQLAGVFAEGDESVPLYGEVSQQDSIMIAVARENWRAQTISIGSVGATAANFAAPISLAGPQTVVQLDGSPAESSGRFEGRAVNLSSGREGTWHLTRVEVVALAPEAESEVRLWLMLKNELVDLEARTRQIEVKLPSQRAEIDKLTSLIGEGETLRIRANDKLRSAQEDLHKVQSQVTEKQKEVKQLEDAFQISTKVTGTGRLVSLARDSLDREWRWLDLLMRSDIESGSTELDLAVGKAERVLAVKREIASEQDKLLLLRNPPNGAQEEEPRARFDFRGGAHR